MAETGIFRSIFWLTFGAFAIGSEGLVIAGILPVVGADLRVSVARAGQLVTAFSLAYAVTTPVLAVITAARRREVVLRIAMGAFAAANVVAAAAPTFAWLMAARVLLAMGAGLFMATAGAYAASSAPPAKRGRAIALVYMGVTVATVVGVPLGTVLGDRFGWRATFVGVAILAALACAGLCIPRTPHPAQPTASLSERVAVARRPDVVMALMTTMAFLAGQFSIYTYLSPLLQRVSGLSNNQIACVLMLFGAGGAAGNLLGGYAADRFAPRHVVRSLLGALVVLLTAISAVAAWVPAPASTALLMVLVGAWGIVSWSFPPAQQVRLIQRVPHAVPVVLSLNSSAMYVGISLGAVFGSFAVARERVEAVGLIGACCDVVALGLASWDTR
ncbi:MFS transporter [Pendulispora brunnea]|uniref:MFS transporter n=1 Tax=Pendulispora brunnea TaxID=2905690 RepID=A0ABZ2KEB4_9BACT